MTDEDVDRVLQGASRTTPQVEPAMLKGIADSINSSLQPVRPLPPPWVLTGGLALICAGVALAAVARAGFHGIEKLTLWESIPIFSTLGILNWVAAMELVRQLIPGSRRHFGAGGLLITANGSLLGIFALVFHDYNTQRFFGAGITCLLTGVLVAFPTSIFSWLVLRRGFAVKPVSAGLAAGTLAGLCGVTMLELHCPNLEALHVLVWHTAVVPAAAAAGTVVAWALSNRSRPTGR